MINTYASKNDSAVKDTLVTLGQPREIAKAAVTWANTHRTANPHMLASRNGGPRIAVTYIEDGEVMLTWTE